MKHTNSINVEESPSMQMNGFVCKLNDHTNFKTIVSICCDLHIKPKYIASSIPMNLSRCLQLCLKNGTNETAVFGF